MKKFFFFAAAAMMAMTASAAYTLNNPVGDDGRYIVKWDCDKGGFAASNDIEVDESFVFAVDVTGTWLADWLLETPAAAGATRGIAINKWTSKGNVNGDTNRMKQISGNIFGMTVNYAQIATDDFSEAMMKDSVLYVYGQIFGFEFTADNPGAGWWMWGENPVDITKAPASPDDALFAFVPYTGTKTSAEFYTSDFEDGMFGYDAKGYAAPCVELPSGLVAVTANVKGAKKVVDGGILYLIDANGVKHSVLGAVVK